jgi:hypothetical protein
MGSSQDDAIFVTKNIKSQIQHEVCESMLTSNTPALICEYIYTIMDRRTDKQEVDIGFVQKWISRTTKSVVKFQASAMNIVGEKTAKKLLRTDIQE